MKTTMTAAFAAALLLCTASPARAEATMALTCIETDTNYTIRYQYRWGDNDEWKDTSVEPGYWNEHWWEYDYPGENRSPTFQVRYDDDLGEGSNFVITKLSSYAAESKDCEGEGKTFEFWADGNELNIGESGE
jgi:hypothetical protein